MTTLIYKATLAAMAFSIIGASGAVARNKSDTIKPDPPSVAKGKSATIPVEPPIVDGSSTEKGIKDAGGCQGCGPVRDHPRPSGGKAGRPKERDDTPHDTSATERSTGGSVKSIPGVGYLGSKPHSKRQKQPKSGKTTLLLPVLGGVTALAALAIAVGGGGKNPVSP